MMAWRSGVIWGVVAVIINFSATSLIADPVLTETSDYYTIDNKTSKKIKAHMNRTHSVDNMDGNLIPTSSWLIRWNFEYEIKDKLCHLYSVRTKIEVSKVIPIWQDGEELTYEQKALWDDYIMHTRKTDESQRETVLKAAHEIENRISKIRPRRDCQQLASAAHSLGHGILAKYRGTEIRNDIKNRLASYDTSRRID